MLPQSNSTREGMAADSFKGLSWISSKGIANMSMGINKVLAWFGEIDLIMAAQTLFIKAHWILGYRQRRRRERLYIQWVNHAGLPPRTIPPEAG